jgi:hypothetical protein
VISNIAVIVAVLATLGTVIGMWLWLAKWTKATGLTVTGDGTVGVITKVVTAKSGRVNDYVVVRCGPMTATFTIGAAWDSRKGVPATGMWVVLSGVHQTTGGLRADTARPARPNEIPKQK